MHTSNKIETFTLPKDQFKFNSDIPVTSITFNSSTHALHFINKVLILSYFLNEPVIL